MVPIGGLAAVTGPGEAYMLSDGVDNDADGYVDDWWDYNPDATDDDENGYGDDLKGVWTQVDDLFDRNDLFLTYTNDTRPTQYVHGTEVAGVIAAVANVDGLGMVGVAPDARILPLRSVYGGGADISLARAIRYARKLEDSSGGPIVDIISLSLGAKTAVEPGWVCSEFTRTEAGELVNPLAREVEQAIADGIVFVVAAGNTDGEIAEPYWWHCFDEVISVAGTRGDSPWLGQGNGGTTYGPWVDLSAPGTGVTSTMRCDLDKSCETAYGLEPVGLSGQYGWGHFNIYGTSVAAPFVSGVAALMLSANPDLDSAELKRKIVSAIDPLDLTPPYDVAANGMGSGRVNAYKALTTYGKIPAYQATYDTTWSGTVWVSGDITVPEGKTLTVAAGTTVKVAQDDLLADGQRGSQVEFMIEGSFISQGTPSEPVTFEIFSDYPDKEWGPFEIVPGDPGQTVVLDNVVFNDLMPVSQVYENTLDATNLDADFSPYASLAFDVGEDGGGDQDLLLTRADGFGQFYINEVNSIHGELPSFERATPLYFDVAERPDDLRGISAVDIDNDGDLDVFGASATSPRLYFNVSGSSFADQGATTVPGGLAAIAGSSWTGAWGDYDRDGFADLYIGRATEQAGEPHAGLQDVILRNRGDGTFSDVSSTVGLPAIPVVPTATVSWADHDADGNLDIFVGSSRSAASVLLGNSISWDGVNGTYVTTFVDATDQLIDDQHHYVSNISAASWIDADSDGDLDLALARNAAAGDGPWILRNDGTGFLAERVALNTGIPHANLTVLDQDLDGAVDLLAVPESSTSTPLLLRNASAAGSLVFDDVTAVVGLDEQAGVVMKALTAADFGGARGAADGDLDLYLGRPTSDTARGFFFKSTAADGLDEPWYNWIRVALRSEDGGNNRFGIGATVTVKMPPAPPHRIHQIQIVDGGSGRGSQRSGDLTFGLGHGGSNVLVEVRWPDGFEQSQTIDANDLNRVVQFDDDHPPSILASEVDSYFLPVPPDNYDRVYMWVTEYSTDPALDRVTVLRVPPPPKGTEDPNCDFGVVTLAPGDPDVEHRIEPRPDGTYRHYLRWLNRPCYAPCYYEYSVTSGVTPTRTETSSGHTHSNSLCFW